MVRRENEFQSLKTVLSDRRQDFAPTLSMHIETVAAESWPLWYQKLDAAFCYFYYRRKLVDAAGTF